MIDVVMNVFIGCSGNNVDKIYIDNAKSLATYLAVNNYNLVVGGINGVMGIIKDIFVHNKMDVIVMSVYGYHEVDDNSLIIYNHNTVSDRKTALISNSNLIIFMPGGLGTIDEIFTSIESKRAGEHNNPIIIININNYYDNLVEQLDKMFNEGFVNMNDKKLYFVAKCMDDVINYIESSVF